MGLDERLREARERDERRELAFEIFKILLNAMMTGDHGWASSLSDEEKKARLFQGLPENSFKLADAFTEEEKK